MLIALALAASAPPHYVKAIDLFRLAFAIPQDLFYLAERPSGTMLCNKTQRQRQTKAFDKRYGARFNILILAARARDGLGWSPDDVLLTPCYRFSQKRAQKMLDAFEGELSGYEARYGLTPTVR